MAIKLLADGLVILFEGIDGVGKTTQLQLAADELESEGWQVHTTRNLGGTPIGEKLRSVSLSDTERSPETDFYISVAIQIALAEALEKERKRGSIILIDRGPLSFAAYHIYGAGVGEELGWRYASEGMKLFRPELSLLFEADTKLALKRARLQSAKADYYESKPLDYFDRVSHGFEVSTKRYPIKRIDAEQSIDVVHEKVMANIWPAIKHKRV